MVVPELKAVQHWIPTPVERLFYFHELFWDRGATIFLHSHRNVYIRLAVVSAASTNGLCASNFFQKHSVPAFVVKWFATGCPEFLHYVSANHISDNLHTDIVNYLSSSGWCFVETNPQNVLQILDIVEYCFMTHMSMADLTYPAICSSFSVQWLTIIWLSNLIGASSWPRVSPSEIFSWLSWLSIVSQANIATFSRFCSSRSRRTGGGRRIVNIISSWTFASLQGASI